MRIRWCALCAGLAMLLGPAATAQSGPDFSGNWILTAPVAGAADAVNVVHTERSLTVEHPSKSGTHPIPGVHVIGGNRVQIRPTAPARDVFWFGWQLVLATTTIEKPATGEEKKILSSELWSIDGSKRLVISCKDSVSGTAGQTVMLVYRKR